MLLTKLFRKGQQLKAGKITGEHPKDSDLPDEYVFDVMDEMDEQFKLLYSDDKQQIKESLDALDSQTPLIVHDEENGYRLAEYDLSLMSDQESNIKYVSLAGLSSQATLADAFDLLKDKRSGAVYIYNLLDNQQIMGLLRWDQIRHILTIRNSLL